MKTHIRGDTSKPVILFLHGMASSARLCFAEVARCLEPDFCCCLFELDGHEETDTSTFYSIRRICTQVETEVSRLFPDGVRGLCGYSLGATTAVELLARNRFRTECAVLDAAFCVKMGLLGPIYREIFAGGVRYLQSGRHISPRLSGLLFGRGNDSALEIFFPGVSVESIRNACREAYCYEIPQSLSLCRIPVLFLRGEREPYPKKSAALLKRCLPQMRERVFPAMGHGQYLHEHPVEYAQILRGFFGAEGGEQSILQGTVQIKP